MHKFYLFHINKQNVYQGYSPPLFTILWSHIDQTRKECLEIMNRLYGLPQNSCEH